MMDDAHRDAFGTALQTAATNPFARCKQARICSAEGENGNAVSFHSIPRLTSRARSLSVPKLASGGGRPYLSPGSPPRRGHCPSPSPPRECGYCLSPSSPQGARILPVPARLPGVVAACWPARCLVVYERRFRGARREGWPVRSRMRSASSRRWRCSSFSAMRLR